MGAEVFLMLVLEVKNYLMKTYEDFLSFKYKLFKELYEDSEKQRSQTNAKFTPTITILSAEIGGVVWMMPKFIENTKCWEYFRFTPKFCLYVAPTFAIIFLIFAIAHFVLCFLKYNPSYLDPEDSKTYIDEIFSKLEDCNKDDIYKNMLKDYAQNYSKIAVDNTKETNRCSKHLWNCYFWILMTLIALTINYAAILF
nr:hypothetical protein [Clostridium sp. AM45-5]